MTLTSHWLQSTEHLPATRQTISQYGTTLFQKKLRPFYFCNNVFIRELIFIIFDSNMRKKICNKTYIVFPTTPNLYAPTLPCDTSGKLP